MQNIPVARIGIVAVSRDCFPIDLSRTRRDAVISECRNQKIEVQRIETIVENEADVMKALEEIGAMGVNALVVFLGNFGPEGPETMLAQKFKGPVMFCAAAEENTAGLLHSRGDAYCGMLNASISAKLRGIRPYIPEFPVGNASEIAIMIKDFAPVARIVIGVKRLKIFSFGPRPHDFIACNAPIKPLFDLGVEVMENSELDLYDLFLESKENPQITKVKAEMEAELGEGNTYPDLLEKLAQYEVALINFYNKNLGASEFGVFANKCWPSFEKYFGFVPCYVNSRLAERGIPVACEVDIYGALTEYMITCATESTATLLDINNTVPYDMYEAAGDKVERYKPSDLFMGFHCGNTSSSCMGNCAMKFQKIMHSLMEPNCKPNITRGTLEGTLKPGNTTIFRVQSTGDTHLQAYIAQGEILDIDPRSFGSIAAFAIPEMARFYRHVLIEKQFPHHAGIAFEHAGKALFSATKLLGINDVSYNQPMGVLYKNENPFR